MGIKEKKLDMGHARAILGSKSAEQQLSLYKRIIEQGLSVRKVEEIVSNSRLPKSKQKRKEPSFKEYQNKLSQLLETKVKISDNKITISFDNEQQFAAIMNHIH